MPGLTVSVHTLLTHCLDYTNNEKDVWTHGDFISIHPITKQIFFLGRSDGVLNPSGIRFGSAEIYNVIDTRFADEIADSICVGQRRPQDPDESVMLFLLMRPGREFTPELVRRVKEAIRRALSARHVSKYVFQTPEIPVSCLYAGGGARVRVQANECVDDG